MEIGSGFSNGIEGSGNAEEILFLGQGETSLNRLFEIFRNLCFFSILSQRLFEQRGRCGAVCMRFGEDNMIGQGSQKMKDGLDVLVLHDPDEKDEMLVLEFFLQRIF